MLSSLRSPPAKRRPRRPFPTQELTGWKGPTRTTLVGLPDLMRREALGCACRYRINGVATARHPKPGTQSIRALPPEVAAMPRMAYVPPRPEPAGPAKVIATASEMLARAVVPPRHSCAPSFLRKQESLFLLIPQRRGVLRFFREGRRRGCAPLRCPVRGRLTSRWLAGFRRGRARAW